MRLKVNNEEKYTGKPMKWILLTHGEDEEGRDKIREPEM